jgi:hypothetical protein
VNEDVFQKMQHPQFKVTKITKSKLKLDDEEMAEDLPPKKAKIEPAVVSGEGPSTSQKVEKKLIKKATKKVYYKF